jgi:hypothetical protein
MEVSCQLNAPTALSPVKEPPVPIGRGWMGPRAGMESVAKREYSRSCWELNPANPARSLVTVLTKLHLLLSTTNTTTKHVHL